MTKQDIQDYKDKRNLKKGFNTYWNKGFDEAIALLNSDEPSINFTHCCTELPDLKDVNDEMYKVSNNLKTDHKQTEVNYYESGFLTCYHWLAKRMKK